MVETETFTVTAPDGDEADVELPVGLVDMFADEDQDSRAEVVADIALMAFTSRAHMVAHHSDGEEEFDADVEAIEEATLDLFEERFGMTYGEATGHSH
ncbi:MAG: hypothetical protein ABEJ04_07085 [Halobacteriaceae archaeon]